MPKKYIYLIILLAIIAIGALLRFYNLDEWFRFANDEVRDLKVISEMVTTKNYIVLGPEAGVGHFHFGPVFFYLLLPAAWLGGVVPLSFAITAVLFSLATIPLLYLLGKKLVSAKFGLLVAGLFSISYLPVIFGRWSWNPHYLPFFVVLFLLGLVYISEKNKLWQNIFWTSMVAIGFGVSIQLHFLALFLGIVVIYFFIAKKFYRKKLLILLPVFLGVLFLLFMPALIYDLQNDWQNSNELIEFVKHPPRNEFHDDTHEQLTGQWNWYSLFVYHHILGKIFGENIIWQSICTVIILATSVFALAWGIIKKKWRNALWAIALFIVITFGFTLAAESEMHVRYLEYVMPFVILWLAYLLWRGLKFNKYTKYISIVLLVIIILAQLMTVASYFTKHRQYRYDMPYVEIPYGSMQRIVEWVSEDANGEPFRIDSVEVVGYPHAFDWVVSEAEYTFPGQDPDLVYRLARTDKLDKYKDPDWGEFISEEVVRNVVIKKYKVCSLDE